MTTKVFLAGSYATKEYLGDIRKYLQYSNLEVTSTWLDEPANAPLTPFFMKLYALNDLNDLRRADILMVFTDAPSTSGGWFTELGVAIERNMPVVLVGKPLPGVYVQLPQVHCVSNATEAIELIREMQIAGLRTGG